MKKRIDILLGLALILVVACDPLGEPINERETEAGEETPAVLSDHDRGWALAQAAGEGFVRFADENFYQACVDAADTDGDLLVSLDEAAAVRELDVHHKGIKDLAGLEAFRNLEVFNAEGNGIVNADVFRELRHLRWFNLKGNPDLESFDLTGCTIYFDRCLFDTSEKLRYKTLLRQLNVTYECDPYSSCAEHIVDTRVSTDWSHHKNLIQTHEHTVGDGKKAVVLSGLGWLDVDFVDGSFRRAMDDLLDYIYDIHPSVKAHRSELDIYIMEYVSESRERFVYPLADFDEEYVEPFRNGYKEWRKEHWKDSWKEVFPEGDGKVLSISMDLHPNVMIVPLRTFGGTGMSFCNDQAFDYIYAYQHNLTVTLDADNMDCFGRMDQTFSRRKEYLNLSNHEDGIKKLFGW